MKISGKRILLADDDVLFCRSLGEQLVQQEDFAHVAITVSGSETIDLLKREHFDVILLKMALPDKDSRDICQVLRTYGVSVPIILLASANGEHNIVTNPKAGANDYVTKPFRLTILLERMRIHLRSHEHSGGAIFSIANYTFQPAAKLLVDNGRRVRLTEKEVAILRFLLQAGNKVVSRDILLYEVWGYTASISTHTLETHIYRLRQKIERDPLKARILLTESGGYRLAFYKKSKQ